jgi:hypothetical protein
MQEVGMCVDLGSGTSEPEEPCPKLDPIGSSLASLRKNSTAGELVRDAWPLALGHQRSEIDPKRCGRGADIPMGTDVCGVAV